MTQVKKEVVLEKCKDDPIKHNFALKNKGECHVFLEIPEMIRHDSWIDPTSGKWPGEWALQQLEMEGIDTSKGFSSMLFPKEKKILFIGKGKQNDTRSKDK